MTRYILFLTALALGGSVTACSDSLAPSAGSISARRGADDPPGDNRNGRGADDTLPHFSRSGLSFSRGPGGGGADDPAGDDRGGHGADDGANHR
jgi:hypothetical protein